MTDDRQDMINEVMDKFNFERVHLAMKALNWEWIDLNTNQMSVPSITQLRKAARKLLNKATSHHCVGSGGFEAKYYPPVDDDPEYFTLKFVLHEADSYDD